MTRPTAPAGTMLLRPVFRFAFTRQALCFQAGEIFVKGSLRLRVIGHWCCPSNRLEGIIGLLQKPGIRFTLDHFCVSGFVCVLAIQACCYGLSTCGLWLDRTI